MEYRIIIWTRTSSLSRQYIQILKRSFSKNANALGSAITAILRKSFNCLRSYNSISIIIIIWIIIMMIIQWLLYIGAWEPDPEPIIFLEEGKKKITPFVVRSRVYVFPPISWLVSVFRQRKRLIIKAERIYVYILKKEFCV